MGTLTRWGVGVLFGDELSAVAASGDITLSGVPTHDLIANMFGSLVMGLCVAYAKQIQRWSGPLYVGLTTGYCGCTTTFSGLNNACAILAWGPLQNHNQPRIFRAIGAMAVGMLLPLCSLQFGKRVPLLLAAVAGEEEEEVKESTPAPPVLEAAAVAGQLEARAAGREGPSVDVLHTEEFEFRPSVLPQLQQPRTDPGQQRNMVLCVGLLLLLLQVLLIVQYTVGEWWWNERYVYLAASISPLGALIRYGTALWNPKFPSFPLFTFTVNITAALLSTLYYVLLQSSDLSTSESNWLLALTLGFNGSLSTVSSLMNEITNLAEKNLYHAYRYAFGTLFVGQFVSFVCLIIYYEN
eukprot:TRINITY_DN21612_c0_g1_i2.p1 TRINITY_DN21612_c0_g1~~TRINITY_DN21612_c0_g1_i2.p1  ORF type:complete len:353 (+),score=63.56 TRINITY_DN21612_c0_g1_i2:331-1389(+)